jgi:hypothetical protein
MYTVLDLVKRPDPRRAESNGGMGHHRCYLLVVTKPLGLDKTIRIENREH